MQCLSNSTGLESIVSLSLFQNTSPGVPHPTLHAETQLLAPPWRIRVLEGRVREERALSETARIWLVTRLSPILPWNNQREILETANMELQAVFQPALSGISRELPSEDRGSWPIPLGGQWLSFFSQSKGSRFSLADPCWRRKHCVLCGMALSYGE